MSGGSARQALTLTFAGGIAQIAQVILLTLFARSAGPDVFGSVLPWMAISLFAIALIDFGSNSHLSRDLAVARISELEYWKLSVRKLAILSTLILITSSSLVDISNFRSLFLVFAISTYLFQLAQIPARVRSESASLALPIASDRILALIIYLLLESLGFSPELSFGVGWVGGGILATALILLRESHFVQALRNKNLPRRKFSSSKVFALHSLAAVSLGLDQVLLSVFGGVTQGGIYGAVNRWGAPFNMLTGAIAHIFAPVIGQNPRLAVLSIVRKSLWLPACSSAVALLGALFAGQIANILLGPAFEGSGTILALIFLNASIDTWITPLAIFLQYRGKERGVGIVSAILSVTYLVALFLIWLLSGTLSAICVAALLVLRQIIFGVALVALEVRHSKPTIP